ncbi:MAG TPA: phytanoyl-CoA dioxygenase family protein [Chthonomonadaceae bacterium]|nr:phytanoyl-CoA dioxygenase family protein [Chthonomonadaceae bacterium]
MLTEAQIAEFRERGFLQAGRIMSDAQADALRARLMDVMEGRGKAQPERIGGWGDERKVIQIVNIWEADDLFYEHLFNPAILEMVAAVIGTDTLRVWHDQVQYKPPKVGGPTDWHQDHPYWPIIQPADLVSAWVALDDADEENGCMWMVPGSHRWGPHKGGTIGTDPETFRPLPDLSLLPPGIDITPVPMPVKKGHVGIHHCLTWHGSPNNSSDRGRPAIAVHYMPGYTRYEKDPGKTHLVEHNVEVQPGEILKGKHFPTVWEHGRVADHLPFEKRSG